MLHVVHEKTHLKNSRLHSTASESFYGVHTWLARKAIILHVHSGIQYLLLINLVLLI